MAARFSKSAVIGLAFFIFTLFMSIEVKESKAQEAPQALGAALPNHITYQSPLAAGSAITSTVTALPSQIAYQGTLIDSGVPVTGNRDMVFRLFIDGVCTAQAGGDIVMNGVSVTDGFFTVYLDVDQNDFFGEALFLSVEVGGNNLGCQPILAVPYALSLRPGATIGGSLTANDGFKTGYTSGDGLYIPSAGVHSPAIFDSSPNGVEISSAQNDGIMVGGTGGDGLDVRQADENGVFIRYAYWDGIRIFNAGLNGLYIGDVGDYGIAVTDGRNYLAGDTGIGTYTPLTRLHVVDSIDGAASTENHVALIENSSTGTSPDVLVLKVGETAANLDPGNNYISFQDGAGVSVGAIQGNSNGGVVLAGPGNDYAEYLPLSNPAELILPGEIVGVVDGKVSKNTTGADLILAASSGAIVAGNDPGEGLRQGYSLVAFLGQVEVRVRGPVSAGDFILPSGLNDGVGIAVAPGDLGLGDLGLVLGQAWEDSREPGVKLVRVLVGLVQPSALSETLQDVNQRLLVLEAALGISGSEP
jgi:hypothetical protein